MSKAMAVVAITEINSSLTAAAAVAATVVNKHTAVTSRVVEVEANGNLHIENEAACGHGHSAMDIDDSTIITECARSEQQFSGLGKAHLAVDNALEGLRILV